MSVDPWYAVALAGLTVPVLLLVRGRRDLLAYLAAYFFVFGFGPVVSYLLGGAIYFGTNTMLIGRASLGLLLAFAGVLAAGLLVRQRTDLSDPAEDAAEHHFPLVPVVLVALSLYAAVVLVLGGSGFLVGTKLDRIGVAGPGHYDYLLLEMLACSLYFMAAHTSVGRFAYRLNLVVYVVYCVSTGERDFVFVLFALILHRELVSGRGFARPVVWGLALLLGATALFSLRGGGPADAGQVLNQGSVLFVDTWVMAHVPSVDPYAHGATYLDALVNLVPGHAQVPLSQWLVDRYAPGSDSGYGFSLTGEAYLNFGLAGIPVLFAGLTLVHRLLVNRIDRAPVHAYASLLFTIAWMYGFRGESASMLKTCVYGLVFYGLIRLVSVSVKDRAPEEVLRPCA
ncbi:O-antigen polysaccharide polymerase Wzy [Dactylosporangium roseum]|uniref:O-antigen polysaccharide polymerase Wzy n=1 Tax=Dactylosporangium roseum TaxID=47989 RepID=A0ABY5Z5J9_9ACTN|nr:O-antigen polysaccharide polymerase Wzy [Dactylosporangium roseum]UWZ37127.1 O-antigen polysaccharide polymerase Wzy [Dactylosporangium roseum]